MELMKYKLLYFFVSLVIILPGLYFLFTSGLKFGIDFTGGALLEYEMLATVNSEQLRQTILSVQDVEIGQITTSGEHTFIIRTKPLEQEKINSIKEKLNKEYGEVQVRREEFVGPVIGAELQRKAIIALSVASVMIVLYIAFSFRKVPKPASSWRFGISAIVAILPDRAIPYLPSQIFPENSLRA